MCNVHFSGLSTLQNPIFHPDCFNCTDSFQSEGKLELEQQFYICDILCGDLKTSNSSYQHSCDRTNSPSHNWFLILCFKVRFVIYERSSCEVQINTSRQKCEIVETLGSWISDQGKILGSRPVIGQAADTSSQLNYFHTFGDLC